jgi:hypothetical protein
MRPGWAPRAQARPRLQCGGTLIEETTRETTGQAAAVWARGAPLAHTVVQCASAGHPSGMFAPLPTRSGVSKARSNSAVVGEPVTQEQAHTPPSSTPLLG